MRCHCYYTIKNVLFFILLLVFETAIVKFQYEDKRIRFSQIALTLIGDLKNAESNKFYTKDKVFLLQ